MVPAERTATGRDITVSEEDLAIFIRSKGAIYTAADTMLTHLGFTRRQMIALVGLEVLAWMAAGCVVGVACGLAIAVVLVEVVNPQSFHWTMSMRVPVGRLALLAAAVLVAGVATAAWSARRAASRQAVLAVKEDW